MCSPRHQFIQLIVHYGNFKLNSEFTFLVYTEELLCRNQWHISASIQHLALETQHWWKLVFCFSICNDRFKLYTHELSRFPVIFVFINFWKSEISITWFSSGSEIQFELSLLIPFFVPHFFVTNIISKKEDKYYPTVLCSWKKTKKLRKLENVIYIIIKLQNARHFA